MSEKKNDRMDLAQSLVAYGKKKGAAEIEVSIQEGTEFNVNVLEGNVDNLTESVFKNLNIRVFVDNKAASASSSDFAADTLQRLVDNAIERAKLGGTDPFSGLPALEEIKAKGEQLKIYDPAIATLPPEKKIELAKNMEAIGLKDKRINKSTGATSVTYTWDTVLANSKGFAGAFQRSIVGFGGGFQSGEGENLFQDNWFDQATQLADLQSPEQVAKKAVERVTRLIGGRKVETQNVPVVFEPSMGAWLLGFLSQCVSGISIARRQSFLADKLGEKVGNELVNIVDDGLLVSGRGTVPFDNEGVPCRSTKVFEKGVLKSYLLDTYWGRKLKLASTGNAGGPNNLYWAAGTSKPEEIIKSVDKGLYLTRFLGLGQEPTTGDISVGAFGIWIEKGEFAFPVANVTISANLGTLLKNVEMVGNDLEMRQAIAAPTIKFAELTIGGDAAKG